MYTLVHATHHFSAEEIHALACAHCLCRRVYVSEQHVRLTAHLTRLDSCDIEYWAESGEEHVERTLEIGFLELLGQVLEVERLVGLYALLGGHVGGIGLRDSSGGHGERECVGES